MKLEIRIPQWRGVAERWKRQYFTDRGDKWYSDAHLVTYEAILAAEKDPDKISAAIGNQFWTHTRCVGCDEYCDRLAVIGDQSYVENTAVVCQECLRDAYFALTSQKL